MHALVPKASKRGSMQQHLCNGSRLGQPNSCAKATAEGEAWSGAPRASNLESCESDKVWCGEEGNHVDHNEKQQH